MKIPDLWRDEKHIIIGRIIRLEYPVEWKMVTAEDTIVHTGRTSPGHTLPTRQEMIAATLKVDKRYGELELFSVTKLQHIEHKIITAAAEEADKELWFNRPAAKADVSFWSKKITWDVDAGTALLFDKEPRYVSWDGIRHRQGSPFAKKYGDARSLILEAVEHKKLPDPLAPAEFLKWAKEMNFDISSDLWNAVMKYSMSPSKLATAPIDSSKGVEKSATSERANSIGLVNQLEPESGLTHREKQIREIERAAGELGYDVMNIPDGGKGELMKKCKLNDSESKLFGGGKDPFDGAWRQARKENRVRMENHSKYAPTK